jgi:fructose 5-dehydrogenase small subunit
MMQRGAASPVAARPAPRPTRRAVLLGSAGTLVLSQFAAAPGGAQQAAAGAIDDAGFLRLSRIATGHQLDGVVASRMLAAIAHIEPTLPARLATLLALAHDGQEPEALLAAAAPAGLDDAMHTLVACWYTGTIGKGTEAQMVAYYDALMYRPVSDGLPVPTYCAQSGIWWEGDPPPIGALPADRPAQGSTP